MVLPGKMTAEVKRRVGLRLLPPPPE